MILLPAILEGVTTRKDKTVKLTFGTQELTPQEAGNIMGMANSYCFLAIKPEDFTPTEKEMMQVIKADAMSNNVKSPSQRMRAVVFLNWKQDAEGFTTFDAYYAHKMNTITEHLKSKLNP